MCVERSPRPSPRPAPGRTPPAQARPDRGAARGPFAAAHRGASATRRARLPTPPARTDPTAGAHPRARLPSEAHPSPTHPTAPSRRQPGAATAPAHGPADEYQNNRRDGKHCRYQDKVLQRSLRLHDYKKGVRI